MLVWLDPYQHDRLPNNEQKRDTGTNGLMNIEPTASTLTVDEYERGILAGRIPFREALDYLLSHRGGRRWPEWEQVLLATASTVFMFGAENCIEYAVRVVGGRWQELERLLLKDARLFTGIQRHHAIQYAKDVVKGRWYSLERILLADGCDLADYLECGVVASRWVRLERAVLRNTTYDWSDTVRITKAYALAIGGAWVAGERILLKASCRSRHYKFLAPLLAEYSLAFYGGDWTKLEKRIRQGRCNPRFAVEYCELLGRGASPAVEEGLHHSPLSYDLFDAVIAYAKRVVGGRWEAGEDILQHDTQYLDRYASEVLHSRLPEHLEKVIVLESFRNPEDPYIKAYIANYGR